MALKVVVSSPMLDENPDSLKAFGEADIEVVRLPVEDGWDSEKLTKSLSEADGCIIIGYKITGAMMDRCPRLRVISRTGVGVESVDLREATRHGIAVTNIAGTDHDSVADATICLLLDMARGFYKAYENVKAGRWKGVFGTELAGKTIGIVGTGRVGKETARRARGFKLDILACDVAPDDNFARKHDVTYTSLDDLLRKSDFVCLNCALTPANTGMIDRRALALMKPNAYLINTARGGLIDEAALLEALRDKRIAGAALDVLVNEPDTSSPFLHFDNVMITPHMGGSSREAGARVAAVAVQNVIEVLKGTRPQRTVNKDVWDNIGHS
jgi:D-3-phosphoglycerate dehydrogenase